MGRRGGNAIYSRLTSWVGNSKIGGYTQLQRVKGASATSGS